MRKAYFMQFVGRQTRSPAVTDESVTENKLSTGIEPAGMPRNSEASWLRIAAAILLPEEKRILGILW